MWLQQFARLEPHEDLVDFLHALVGFCEEEQEQSDDEMETVPKSGTRTRKKSLFTLPKGVNGVIIGGVFKILISRVAEMNFFDLKNLVSVTVYSIEYFIVNYYRWWRLLWICLFNKAVVSPDGKWLKGVCNQYFMQCNPNSSIRPQ